jgi:hypothetical protein
MRRPEILHPIRRKKKLDLTDIWLMPSLRTRDVCLINEMDDLVLFSSVGPKICENQIFEYWMKEYMQCKALQMQPCSVSPWLGGKKHSTCGGCCGFEHSFANLNYKNCDKISKVQVTRKVLFFGKKRSLVAECQHNGYSDDHNNQGVNKKE